MAQELHTSTTSPYTGFFVFDQPFLLIRDLDLIKKVLITDFNYFTDRTPTTSKKDTVGSKFSFLLKGNVWKEVRKFNTTLFSLSKLKNMIVLINEIGDNVVQHLENNIHEDSIDSRDVSLKYSLDVISSCAFGFEANALKCGKSPLIQASNLVNLFSCTFSDVDASKTLSKIFMKVFEERKKSGKIRNDFIDTLNNIKMDGINLSDEYIAGTAIQILFAGHETAGTALSFLMFELSQHVDVQDRLRDEVIKVLKDVDGDISQETINKITYLDMVISETLRKYPVLGYLDRRCVKPYKIRDTDLIIEKGTPIYISVLALHYDEKTFHDPEKFDPERFSDENKLLIPPCAYMPFGEGNRYCVGKLMALTTMKIFVVKVISKYEIKPTQDTPKTITFDKKSLLLAPENGVLKLNFSKI
ncbi:hypothetical protein FQR65_LT06055 [Abscondita terminalis]|nr:hypothetical protein FQR65_LT06055 [Abscondita terminalis]